ncbi:phage portal protein [Oceaniovalibus sp. ACAM 378]|uniref:phage portal protein n=1 Tax=Oceaniovalibus sp. ACAM 378 TaxID=2599923 RepID=UPI0021038264|nr:phage portal protein [Oceaniovalibus sp. ACAM 378]
MAFDKIKSALGFKPEAKALTLTNPEAFSLFGAVPTTSGIHVGPGNAMRVPAVACAVSLISETIGALPAKLFNRDDKSALTSHPIYRLIHDEVNPWTSAEQLRKELTADALLTGHGYALVTRNGAGQPLELHRLDPAKVQREQADDGEPTYRVSYDQGQRLHSYTDILHIEAFGGVAPITLGREAIALALSFEAHIGGVFANGGRPSGVITAEKSLDAEAKRKLAASWFANHGGKNAGATALLDEGMKYAPVAMTLSDAQFSENRLEQIREIARVFRVPPTMLFELSRGTWSNTEEMARQFYAITLKPWLASWAWAYARCLLTPEERTTFYVEFVTDDLLTTDAAARAASYGQYRSMGAMTANEVRSGLNLQPRSDGDDLQNPYTSTGAPV